MSEATVDTGKVTVDLSRCEGHARCLQDAPAVFRYDDVTSQAFVRPGADVEGNRETVEAAIRGCPEAALKWVAAGPA